jgi:hypothetical protein
MSDRGSLNKHSMLVGAIRAGKGMPDHYESEGDFAACQFDNGKLTEIHTPKDILRRVHETMHANHTSQKRYQRDFKGVKDTVAQFVEDCWLHEKHWPWKNKSTPKCIKEPCSKFIGTELKQADEFRDLIKSDGMANAGLAWPEFALRLRGAAVIDGIRCGRYGHAMVGFDDPQKAFANEILELIQRGKKRDAALMLQEVFFPPQPGTTMPGNGQRTGQKPPLSNGRNAPPMEVIELRTMIKIDTAENGWCVGRSGTRIIRSAVMRPVPSQYAFMRRIPTMPGGTILIDASGSMGSWEQVSQWCMKAPQATVAYYAGHYGGGQLYVYARNGYRAEEIVEPIGTSNDVDGHAIDWLLREEGPRIMVTDRGFCGSSDSAMQVLRLARLEREGKITVMDYSAE